MADQTAGVPDGSYEEYLQLYSAINRQTLATAADHWESVAAALTDVAGGLGVSRDGLLANGGWSSNAADTFGAYMDTLVQQTQGLSTAAAALSGGLRHATNTANQLAHNFPPQPPPPSNDPTVREWTFPDGTTMQGTATDVRTELTYQARKAVIAVYDDYSHAAQKMAQAQAAAPTPSGYRADPSTAIPGSSSPATKPALSPTASSVRQTNSGSSTARSSTTGEPYVTGRRRTVVAAGGPPPVGPGPGSTGGPGQPPGPPPGFLGGPPRW